MGKKSNLRLLQLASVLSVILIDALRECVNLASAALAKNREPILL